MITDVILENESLFKYFVKIFNHKNIGYSTLVDELNEAGIKMDIKRLQRFIKHGSKKKVTQKAYIYLLGRHGLTLELKVNNSVLETSEDLKKLAKQMIE